MKLFSKLILLFLSFIVLTSILVLLTYYLNDRQMASLYCRYEKDLRRNTENILELNRTSLKNLAFDYSYWDEMVSFVRRPDRQWAAENIEATMNNFPADAAWVLNETGNLIYHSHLLPKQDSIPLQTDRQQIQQWLSGKVFSHYFIFYDQNVFECFGAPIQPSADLKRTTEPKGYLIFARLWSDQYLQELGNLLDSRVFIVTDLSDTPDAGNMKELIIKFPLRDSGNKTAGMLSIFNEWPYLQALKQFEDLQTTLGILFSIIIIIVFPLAIYRWVIRPLRRIGSALSSGDSAPIDSLTGKRGEFGELARLVSDRFRQSAELTARIKVLSGTEQEIRSSGNPYREILDRQMDAVLIFDAEYYRCLEANLAALSLYGYSPEEIRNITALDISEDKSEIIQIFRNIIHEGRETELKQQQRRSDGTVFQAKIRAFTIALPGQTGIGMICRNITTRIDAENRLREQHADLRQIIDLTPNYIFVKDREGRIVLANRSLADLRGMTTEEMTGKTEEEINPNLQDIQRFDETDREIIETGKEIFIPQERIILPDGTIRWLQTVKRPIYGADGEVKRIVGVATDITFHKEAEEKILRLYHLYAFLSRINEAIVRIKERRPLLMEICAIAVQEGQFRLAWTAEFGNDEKPHLTAANGIETDELESLLKSLPTDRFHKDPIAYNSIQTAGLDPLIKFLSAQWGIQSFAAIPLHNRKERTGLFAVFSPTADFFDAEEMNLMKEIGQGISYALEAIDLEEDRRQTERDLKILFRAVEQSQSMVMITDDDGFVEYVNPKYTEISGFTEEEIIGKKPNFLKEGFLSDEDYRQLKESLKSGHEWKGEFRNIRKDGSSFWESAVISPVFSENNDITHFIAIKEDITRQKQMESDLLQAQKMDSIGRLAGGVAHDFNNLLTAILGYGSMLQFRLPVNSPLREDVNEIVLTAKRAANLTQQLLAFSRKQVMNLEVIDLNEAIMSGTKLLRRVLEESIELITVPDTEPVMIRSDRSQVDQVLMNLVINARDAIHGQGKIEITVTSENAVKNDTAPNDTAVLTVTDNGCGMTQDLVSHIFEPFFTTKEKGKGTGLGLSTVYGIVKQSGGEIRVQSEPGRGTVFTIRFPLCKTDDAGGMPVTESIPQDPANETILLVEDDETVCGLVREILENTGYRVLIALRGDQAVSLAESHKGPIHLLLTDIIMPGMDGKQLADELRTTRPELKILFMSGYAEDKLGGMSFDMENTAFMHKPFLPETLTGMIRVLLDSKPASGKQPT